MDFNGDLEVTVDLSKSEDVEEIMNFRTSRLKAKRRSSFFKPNELPVKKENSLHRDIRRDRYLEALNNEQGDWMNLVRNTNSKIKSSVLKEKVPVDLSVLTKERREYLEQALDLPTWFKETEEFTQQTVGYIKYKEWLKMRLKFVQDQLESKLIDATIEKFP